MSFNKKNNNQSQEMCFSTNNNIFLVSIELNSATLDVLHNARLQIITNLKYSMKFQY